MEIFMADLWQVFRGAAPDEYKDSTQFFGKTYQTDGLKNLLQSNFDNLQIELLATEGQTSDQDYEDKIKEAFVQLGIDPEE